MPGPSYIADPSYSASGAITRFKAVKLSDVDTVTAISLSGVAADGVAQMASTAAEATAGKVIPVRHYGVTRMIAGDVINLRAPVQVDATGRAIPLAATTAKQEQIGIALKAAAAANDVIYVLLTTGVQRDT